MKQQSKKWLYLCRRSTQNDLSFEPSENLENSTCTGKKSESCFSCSSIYTAHPAMGGVAHIYICRCELIFSF